MNFFSLFLFSGNSFDFNGEHDVDVNWMEAVRNTTESIVQSASTTRSSTTPSTTITKIVPRVAVEGFSETGLMKLITDPTYQKSFIEILVSKTM